MTDKAATAYGCVAYRMMEYEGNEMTEEYLSILMEMLYDFYTPKEIVGIYQKDIRFDAYEAMIKNPEILNG